MASKLCQYCLLILSTNNASIHAHHSTAGNLLTSAAGGCSLCTLLCDSLYHTRWPGETAFGKDAVKFKFYLHNDYLTGSTSVPTVYFFVEFPDKPNQGKGRIELYVRVLITPAQIAPGSNAVRHSPSNRNTECEESWNVATDWLEKCTNTHSKCHLSSQPRLLPTRLLDLGSHTNPTLRLYETDGKPSTVPYLTLSHCWGGVPIISLTKASLPSMRESITASTLPKTFQDAISITRRFSIRYLWIDSLCIIQDSKPDWARESSMMGSVYQNGLCNIAATAAADGNVGCYLERDPLLAQPCRVRLERDLGKFGLKKGMYDLVPSRLWEEGLSEAPLLRRAWVVQERVLSQRVLHFGRNQLFWECNELDACEMYPTGLPSALSQSSRRGYVTGGEEYGFKSLQFKNLDPATVRSEVQVLKIPWTYSFIAPLPSGPDIDSYYVWNKIITAYTRCGITNPTDKLVAISAIAKQIQTTVKDVYLAGMWKRHLPYHLLWVADQGAVKRERMTKEYVAPSWSWASMNAPIEPYVYIRPDNPVMVQILSPSITPMTSDAFGQVSAGHIKLRGWLRKFRVSSTEKEGVYGAPTISQIVQFDELQREEQEVWFLPVVSLGPWIAFEALGLLLQETGEGVFRRVGRFRASEDLAKKYFRRPTYPLEVEGEEVVDVENTVNGVSSGVDKSEKWGWFGKRKKADDTKGWTERVITII